VIPGFYIALGPPVGDLDRMESGVMVDVRADW
jgi:hypothetical protein